MDFILWPRNDIEKIVCLLFSRWKGSDEAFRPVQVFFLTQIINIWGGGNLSLTSPLICYVTSVNVEVCGLSLCINHTII